MQDWKVVGDRLVVSGIFKDPQSSAAAPTSRLLMFDRFLEPAFECRAIRVPVREGIELGHEGMAVTGEFVLFLPEDLGASNRLFRASLAELGNVRAPERPQK